MSSIGNIKEILQKFDKSYNEYFENKSNENLKILMDNMDNYIFNYLMCMRKNDKKYYYEDLYNYIRDNLVNEIVGGIYPIRYGTNKNLVEYLFLRFFRSLKKQYEKEILLEDDYFIGLAETKDFYKDIFELDQDKIKEDVKTNILELFKHQTKPISFILYFINHLNSMENRDGYLDEGEDRELIFYKNLYRYNLKRMATDGTNEKLEDELKFLKYLLEKKDFEMLYIIFKVLSEDKVLPLLVYNLHTKDLYKIVSLFGGLTFRIPTIQELEKEIRIIKAYYYKNVKDYSWDKIKEMTNNDVNPLQFSRKIKKLKSILRGESRKSFDSLLKNLL